MTPKVFIATPCHSGRPEMAYVTSLIDTTHCMRMNGMPFGFSHTASASIDTARNLFVDDFLKTDATHLLFIDDDICWAGDLPIRLLQEQRSIIGVPYRLKEKRVRFAVRHDDQVLRSQDKPYLIQVKSLAMGMTLIERTVFETLRAKVPLYHGNPIDDAPPIRMFFQHSLSEERENGAYLYHSEDFYFCEQATKANFTIWAYIDEEIAHIGKMAFVGRYHEHLGNSEMFTSERPRHPLNVNGVQCV